MGDAARVGYDGLSPAELAARIRARSCLVLPSVTSALDIIHELAAEGAPGGTVVLADEQIKGRGREGRLWLSPAGAGILLGFLHRPLTDAVGGVLALRVGLAVADALNAIGLSPRLKWPNDILVRGRKAGGVLCEGRSGAGGWVAVGVGLNVHGPLPAALSGRGIALDEDAPGVTRIAVLEGLVPRLQRLADGATLSDSERAAYGRFDWLAGREVSEPVRGRVSGVDVDGALLVETGNGTRRVVTGSVVESPAGSAVRLSGARSSATEG